MEEKEKLKLRQEEMANLRKKKFTLEQIGEIFHLSRQRVHQIINNDYDKPSKPSKFREIISEETDVPLAEKYPQLRSLSGRDYNRELVRIRDNHTCQLCGHKWEEGERRLDVHHLDCRKEKTQQYDKPSEFGNLITLCHGCHLNVPAHRLSMSK